jgi:hypothetical protein
MGTLEFFDEALARWGSCIDSIIRLKRIDEKRLRPPASFVR